MNGPGLTVAETKERMIMQATQRLFAKQERAVGGVGVGEGLLAGVSLAAAVIAV